jgi:predicted DNA binding protein
MTVGILTDPSMVVATSSGGTRETLFTQLNTVASGNAANALESSLASRLLPIKDRISQRRRVDSAETTLTLGQINAVRAAFKAGITPTRIARQFGISQSNVRKALATDETKQ